MKAKVLIIGASGYVGARLYYELRKKYNTVGTYHSTPLSDVFLQLDVTREKDVEKLVKRVHPNIIIDAAANSSSKWCENHFNEAKILNVTATKFIVKAAGEINAKVIFISSAAALEKVNVYGRTKAESEKIVQKINKWIILRLAPIIGYSPSTAKGRMFNRILRNIKQKTPVIYDNSWKFQPSYLKHIVEVIAIIIDKDINAQIIPVVVSDLKSRFDVARDILNKFNIKVTPKDKQDKTPILKDDLSKLKELGLPIYEYNEVIEACVDEIRHREQFRL
jgi:dTDP-4-dehydrorhamnose reductase